MPGASLIASWSDSSSSIAAMNTWPISPRSLIAPMTAGTRPAIGFLISTW
jgi:hypothetical protein